jgi:hypothetical protein
MLSVAFCGTIAPSKSVDTEVLAPALIAGLLASRWKFPPIGLASSGSATTLFANTPTGFPDPWNKLFDPDIQFRSVSNEMYCSPS